MVSSPFKRLVILDYSLSVQDYTKEDIFENSIIPTDKLLPSRLNIIPLQGRPIFPNIFTPLMLNSTEDIKIVDEAYEQGGFIGIVMVKNETESPTYSDLFKIGTVARIIRKVNLLDGGINIFISTIKRFKLSCHKFSKHT